MREFLKGEVFCKYCFIHETFWKNGGSWSPDLCPICKKDDWILWQDMSFTQKIKANKLFDEWWEKERIDIRMEN